MLFLHLYIEIFHSLFPQYVFRQVQSFFPSEFYKAIDLVRPPSIFIIPSFP